MKHNFAQLSQTLMKHIQQFDSLTTCDVQTMCVGDRSSDVGGCYVDIEPNPTAHHPSIINNALFHQKQ